MWAPHRRSRAGGGSSGVERECGGACSARSRLPAGAACAQCGAPPRPHLGARARLTTTTRAPTHPPRTFASLPRVRATASTSRFPLLSRAMRRIRIPPRRPRRSIKPQAPVKVQTPAERAPTGRKKNRTRFGLLICGRRKKKKRRERRKTTVEFLTLCPLIGFRNNDYKYMLTCARAPTSNVRPKLHAWSAFDLMSNSCKVHVDLFFFFFNGFCARAPRFGLSLEAPSGHACVVCGLGCDELVN